MSERNTKDVSDEDFDQVVLNSDGISVVDFWAPWCGPCHTMAPGLESFAKANAGRVSVFKVDADDNPKTAERYEIRSVPTVIFFKDGEPIEVFVGAMSEVSLQKKVDTLLER